MSCPSQTPECPSHHEHHENCTACCSCCGGKSNAKRTLYFVLVLIVIIIISVLIIRQKQSATLPLPVVSNQPHLILLGDSRCQKCAPMFDVFSQVQSLSPTAYTYTIYNKKSGEFPYQIKIEPTVILLDSALNELSRLEGVHSAEAVQQFIKKNSATQ